MAASILPFQQDDVDFSDYLGEPMFSPCVERYGAPTMDECYGFFPALAIAGLDSPTRSVDHIKRVKALEHYTFLAQLDTFYLTRIGPSGFESVRPIG
ncbi:T6SS immunity protein Tdi1 domain-containing protein [Fulvimarina sp. MAC8]|uniref:T6SS immunity protein Tdi1 domain-containing protein n=1 Tax=Fulvimarina sp. MAC8 TaxID=3162874 RepID=UPI0032EE5C5F